jgi:hypothetical protein
VGKKLESTDQVRPNHDWFSRTDGSIFKALDILPLPTPQAYELLKFIGKKVVLVFYKK